MEEIAQPDAFLNYGRVLRLSAMRYHDHPALEFEGEATSYVLLNEQVNAMANALAARGVISGDRVILCAPNGPDYVRVMFALAKLGAIAVPTNTGLLGEDLAHVLQATSPRLVAAAPQYLARVRDALSLAERDGSVEVVRILPDSANAGHALEPETLSIAGFCTDEPPEPTMADSETAILLFTSGSMGTPKAVAKSYRNLTWHAINRQLSQPRHEGDRELFVLPLSGVGFGNFLLTDLMVGGTCVLEPRFDPHRTAHLLAEGDIRVAFLAPTMLMAVDAAVPGASYPSVAVLETAYEITPAQRQRISAMFPSAQIHYSYGCTEGSMARASGDAFLGDPTNVGYASGLDEYRAPAEAAGLGEIEVSGPSVMQGYLRAPGAIDAGDVRGGWFATGDLGYQDANGAVHFGGRVKDMIKTGGLNVFAADVEAALAEHRSVSRVAVIGVPDEYWGEAVVAVVEFASNVEVSEGELRTHAKETLAGFKRPKTYLTVDHLPLNPGGKLAKGEIRSMIETGGARPLQSSREP